MESFKKCFKLLCYSLIMLLMFGLGGECIFAAPQSITVTAPGSTPQEQSWYFEWVPTGGYQNSLIKKDQEGHYVFCLDSNQKLYSGQMNLVDSLTGYQEGYKDKIARVLANAYRLGLGDNNATHTIAGVNISEKDLYGVTQTAIWAAAHGENPAGGYTQKYKTWVESKGYKKIFEELMKEYKYERINEQIVNFDLIFAAPAQPADDNYYYSDSYILKNGGVPDDVKIQVKGPSISVGSGVQVKIKDGDWQDLDIDHSYTIKAGDRIVTRKVKPTSGSSNYSYSISTGSYIGAADVYFYSSPENFQNIVLGTPNPVTSTKINKNSYDTVTTNKKTIKIIKKSGSEYVGDATLRLYIPDDSNNSNSVEATIINDFITPWPTDENATPSTSFSVDVGQRYCVKELSAPYGYLLSETPVCVDVTNESTDDELTITMQNEKLKVKYRKVDRDGNPISGVEIKIFNYVKSELAHKTDNPYICAISDDQGYLTIPCSGKNSTSDYYAGNGEYYYEPGVTETRSGNIYYIQETFKDGYYVKAFDANDEDHATTMDFYLSDKVFFTEYSATNYIKLSGELGTANAPTINIINDKYLKFSKVDTGTGKEIPGAKMVLYDASVTDTALSDEPLFVKVDEWISTDKPHIVQGIIPEHEYILSEEVAPENYVKLKTEIRFKMKSDGTVEVLTKDQELVKPKDDTRNWVIVGNDAIVKAPNTGISLLNTIAIGGLMVFVGYEAMKIYRKRTA